MNTLLKSVIVVSALVAGGSAFAADNGSESNSQLVTESRIAFAAQGNIRSLLRAPEFTASFQSRPTTPISGPAHAQNLSQSAGN